MPEDGSNFFATEHGHADISWINHVGMAVTHFPPAELVASLLASNSAHNRPKWLPRAEIDDLPLGAKRSQTVG